MGPASDRSLDRLCTECIQGPIDQPLSHEFEAVETGWERKHGAGGGKLLRSFTFRVAAPRRRERALGCIYDSFRHQVERGDLLGIGSGSGKAVANDEKWLIFVRMKGVD